MKLRACIVCQELHHELFGLDAAESHVVKNFSNPHLAMGLLGLIALA